MSRLSLGLNEPAPPDPSDVDAPDSEAEPRPFAVLRPPPLRARRPAVVFSGIIHALSLLALVALVRVGVMGPPPPAPAPLVRSRVFLPPRATLRALQGLPPLPRPHDDFARNRISIGAPSPERHPLVLRPEDDLTRAPRGERQAQGDAGQYQPAETPEKSQPAEAAALDAGSAPGERSLRRFQVGNAIARAVAASSGRWGDVTGDSSGMGLQFDPEGADFSRWMQQFKNEVYRNWIVPQSVLWGWGGQVSFEFVVERGGTITTLTTLSGSGTAALDRAAQHALTASRLLPLPDDFAPSQVTMRVIFTYGPPPDTHARAGSRP